MRRKKSKQKNAFGVSKHLSLYRLGYLNEAGVLHNLRLRYNKDVIYVCLFFLFFLFLILLSLLLIRSQLIILLRLTLDCSSWPSTPTSKFTLLQSSLLLLNVFTGASPSIPTPSLTSTKEGVGTKWPLTSSLLPMVPTALCLEVLEKEKEE